MRYIICQPMGGLNDSLCQIGKCIEYAIKYNRKLIIDTNMISDFNDHFSNYFQLQEPNDFIQLKIDKTQYPELIKTTLEDSFYTTDPLNPDIRVVDNDIDYPDDVILHRSYGGGFKSMIAMNYFKLDSELSLRIKKLINDMGSYHAVMIRNSDYKTDYMDALKELERLDINVPLLLTTDDYKVQDYAKTLNFKKLLINTNLYKNEMIDTPIMHVSRVFLDISPKTINDQVLTDLMLAANAAYIYPTRVVGTIQNSRQFENDVVHSGFIILAMNLNQDKELFNRVLG